MQSADQQCRAGRTGVRMLLGYSVLLAIAAAVFYWIRAAGAQLSAPSPLPDRTPFGQAGELARVETLLHLLLALAVIIAAARTVGLLFRRLGQPAVIGEVVAGILLGPSLLAGLLPEVHAYLLPDRVMPYIEVIAQVGVILYMFLVGLEFDASAVRGRGGTVLAISHASIIVPFLLGAVLSLWLYPRFSTSDVPFVVFVLFIGISMAVTALPVLARILGDLGVHASRIGVIALTSAAIGDVTAWCMLAVVVGVAKANLHDALATLAWTALYVSVMTLVVRRLMARLARRAESRGDVGQATIGLVLVLLLLSAFVTEWIGIHALFGAFLLGVLIPPDCRLTQALRRCLHDVVVVLFLPAYFAFTGVHTQLGLIDGAQQWVFCGLIVLVASFGKFAGSVLAARYTGLGWREGSAVGVLMNTRGLMELVVLGIGYELKVLSPALFTMLVLMAIVTTVATAPLLQRLTRPEQSLARSARNLLERSR